MVSIGSKLWKDGDRYEGEWKDGKQNGRGKKERKGFIESFVVNSIIVQ